MKTVFTPASPFARVMQGAVASVVLLLLALTATAVAEPRFSFDTTPGKLPKTVVPIHYAIELELDLENLKVSGSEVVDIEVREPTSRLTLNADDITLSRATIDDGAQLATISADAAAETVTLTFPKTLAAGRHKLAIAFSASIHKSGPGLYAVDYETDQGARRLLSSHLAPGDARRVFPGWDEPAFKATFALTVTVPNSFQAIGN